MTLYLAATIGLLLLLTIVSFIDIRRMVIPDWANLTLLLLGVLVQISVVQADVIWVACSTLALGGLFWAIRYVHHRMTGRIGLGMGDVKMAGAAGAWIGLNAIPSFLLFSSVSALIAALSFKLVRQNHANARIPFGPFLASGLMACWLIDTASNAAFLP